MSRNNYFGFLLVVLVLPINTWALSPEDEPVNQSLAFLQSHVKKVLDTNPELLALKAKMESVQSQLRGAGLPIYNPELEVEIESAADDVYKLKLTQSIDWNDKGKTRESAQLVVLQQTEVEYRQLTLTLASETLSALADYYMASNITQLRKQSVKLLEQIAILAENRLSAGDIDKSEVLLAKLALADAVIQHADQGVKVIEAEKVFYTLSQQPIDKTTNFLIPLPDKIDVEDSEETIASEHPQVKFASLQVELARRQVAINQRERRADPDFGFTIGKEDDDTLVGIQFTMPWQIRNNYSYTVDVAQQELLQAEYLAQNTYRQIVANIKAAKTHYLLKTNAWKIWSATGQNQLTEHIQLLEQLWKSGEISTTDYLVQLEQNIRTRVAGAELNGDVWHAWFQWLNATGQVLSWLKLEEAYALKGDEK